MFGEILGKKHINVEVGEESLQSDSLKIFITRYKWLGHCTVVLTLER